MTDSRRWLILGAFTLFGWLVYLLGPVLTPFMLGAVFAYLGDPLADKLESWKLSRTAAVVVVFLTLTVIMALSLIMVLPAIQSQLKTLAIKAPVYLEWVEKTAWPWLMTQLGADTEQLKSLEIKSLLLDNMKSAGGILKQFFAHVTDSGMGIIAWIGNMVLVPVVTFYLLRDWDFLVERLKELLPRHLEPLISKLAGECDEVLGAFIRGQLMVMVALGIIYSVGLSIVGLDLALLLGMLAGLASIVPYLGVIIGIIAAGTAALVQFQSIDALVGVAIVFGIGQLVEGFILTPLLVGDKIGLHPVAVIFAIMAGGQLFGFTGVLLALPVAAVIMVLLRYAHERYLASSMYQQQQAQLVSEDGE